MMISPEGYYEEYLKGKTASQIISEIRSLKREITHLKSVVEHPDYQPSIHPDESTRIWCDRLYLERAKQALTELGEEYIPTKAEQKAILFDESIPEIRSMTLEIGGFLQGHVIYTLSVCEGNVVQSVEDYAFSSFEETADGSNLEYTTEEFFEAVRDLHLGEWRKTFTTERFGIVVLDGTQWSMKIDYGGKLKPIVFEGDNAFPYNFEQVKALFGVSDR